MVLEQLKAGAPRHLFEDDGTRKLAFMLCLPLIDGVFATLLITGAVNTFSQMINVAVTVFAGAGAIAVLYSESESRQEAVKMINGVIPVVLAGALIVALIAPIFESMFNTVLLKYAAALAVTSIGLQMLQIECFEKMHPAAILITGMVLSYQGINGVILTASYIIPALLTVGIATLGLYLASYLKRYSMNIEYIRYGGSIVLFIISLSLMGLQIPETLGPLVFAGSIAISIALN